MSHLKRLWVDTGDYSRVCEQLKSVRQDLTIQGVTDTYAALL